MEIQLLKSFVAVAETGSMSEAALRLGYSQSAVSRHLRHLEKLSHCTLVDRDTRPLTLTQEGRDHLLIALKVVRLLDRLLMRTSSQPSL
ncbi:MAG: LysR family transcriptional regulator [Nocardioides sp.]